MNRVALVYIFERYAGKLEENEDGYRFEYNSDFLNNKNAKAVSQTLPLRSTPYQSTTMFPFFDGLIPEGWLLHLAEKHWKITIRDRMGLLMACCKDCIGAVSILPEDGNE